MSIGQVARNDCASGRRPHPADPELSALINERAAFSASIALRLEAARGTSAQFSLGMQASYSPKPGGFRCFAGLSVADRFRRLDQARQLRDARATVRAGSMVDRLIRARSIQDPHVERRAFLYSGESQPKCVADHGDRAQTHCGRRDEGTQENAERGVQDARRYRNPHGVVDKR
jgi:hypothetical protein